MLFGVEGLQVTDAQALPDGTLEVWAVTDYPAAAANASCATGQEIPACRAASAGVIPRSLTSAAACSRSRAVIRHHGGTCGTRSVNVLRSQPCSSHFQRCLTQHTATGSPPRRTSRGRASTVSCRRDETVPQSGHAAAAG